MELPLRGPKPSDVGDDLEAARQWAAQLGAGRHGDTRYPLQRTSVAGRCIGRHAIPARALVTSFDQAWALLGVAASIRHFDGLVEHGAGLPRTTQDAGPVTRPKGQQQ